MEAKLQFDVRVPRHGHLRPEFLCPGGNKMADYELKCESMGHILPNSTFQENSWPS